MINVLIVEDEAPISNMIRLSLTKEKYRCTCAFDGTEAADYLEKNQYDLILLDVMLPEIDGFELMDYIRPLAIPVIFLTAKDSVQDRVNGLKLGAEDYIVKPFEAMELLARIEVVLRRYNKEDHILSYDDILIDTEEHSCRRGDEYVSLTPKEFELLIFFIKHPDVAITRARLLSAIWGYEFEGESRTVDIHIQQLRKKLGLKDKLVTLPKLGYRLNKKF